MRLKPYISKRENWNWLRIPIAWFSLFDAIVEVVTFGWVHTEISVSLMIWDFKHRFERRYRSAIVPLQEDLIDELADIAAEAHERRENADLPNS